MICWFGGVDDWCVVDFGLLGCDVWVGGDG